MTASTPARPARRPPPDRPGARRPAGRAGLARHFLRLTVRDLSGEQARQRTTASELTLGGLIKHVAATEQGWAAFILEGPSALGDFSDMTEADMARWPASSSCSRTRRWTASWPTTTRWRSAPTNMVASLPDLNLSHPLPNAPWFPPGERRSARWVFLHIIAETAQHAGHADIIRESLDGAKSMG